MTQRFTGKSALVTGAGSGIGSATAEWLSGLGAPMAIVGNRAAQLEATRIKLTGQGGQALFDRCRCIGS